MKRIATAIVGVVLGALPALAQQVNVTEFTLENGMKFLLYPRTEQPNIIAAGWVAKVGSVNERPGITGISHFFEHMMFKGTNTIGTKDPARDREFRAEQNVLRQRILDLTMKDQYRRFRAGEIDDPWDPANDTDEMAKLRGELKASMERQRAESIVKTEFDEVYTKLGASGMNAFTSEDVTFYFINVPSNKFELWAWMESDRLTDSVFREFFSERDVVHEERRLRTESTPTGIFDEQFEAMFWQSSPYNWPVIGWTSDLNSYTMEQAQDYYDTYYQPSNLTGVVVGDFKIEEVKPIIERYFGRLSPGTKPVPPVATLEMPQQAEQRMIAECDCQPQVEVRYKAVPWNHADEAALEVLAGILNGRSGRLYKNLIEGAQIASSAFAGVDSRKYGGAFSFAAETKGDAKPEMLEEAWYKEVERLQNEPVSERELQKVKNQEAANAFRRLQNNFFLLVQMGLFEAAGDWRYINEHPRAIQAVTAEDVKRVANTYFARKNRSVAIYNRLQGLEPEDPELLALGAEVGPQMKDMVKRQLEQLKQISDPARLQQIVGQMESQKGQVPPQMAKAFDYMLKKVKDRITELEKGGN
ncbi:MAG TPA: hypothetical protein DEB06_06855 [Phycisphaerales bacterium]|nr:hypothetical protein [Phycisphaerales bacterium]